MKPSYGVIRDTSVKPSSSGGGGGGGLIGLCGLPSTPPAAATPGDATASDAINSRPAFARFPRFAMPPAVPPPLVHRIRNDGNDPACLDAGRFVASPRSTEST